MKPINNWEEDENKFYDNNYWRINFTSIVEKIEN
jgi:hypothetical protein